MNTDTPVSPLDQRRVWHRLIVMIGGLCLAGCAHWPFGLEQPEVSVAGLELLPSRGLEQRLAVHLRIANPNNRDLSVRGISYKIGIENIDLLSGVANEVPLLKANEQTPVTVEASVNWLALARLAEHFGRRGVSDRVSYRFRATIDYSRWLPDRRVEERGEIPLQWH